MASQQTSLGAFDSKCNDDSNGTNLEPSGRQKPRWQTQLRWSYSDHLLKLHYELLLVDLKLPGGVQSYVEDPIYSSHLGPGRSKVRARSSYIFVDVGEGVNSSDRKVHSRCPLLGNPTSPGRTPRLIN
jgi:hypothetical protein